MNRRSVMSLGLATLGAWLVRSSVGHAATEPKSGDGLHQVALHLNSDDERVQKGALSNIKNLYEEFGPGKVKIELITNGPGVKLFVKKETKFAEELVLLKTKYGV